MFEDPEILRLNIERYQRLLRDERNPVKRQQIMSLLQEVQSAQVDPPSQHSAPTGTARTE